MVLGDDYPSLLRARRRRERWSDEDRACGAEDKQGAGASEQLDAVVLSIARLIGRRMAREDYAKAMRAANDNSACDRKVDAEEANQPLMNMNKAAWKRVFTFELRLSICYLEARSRKERCHGPQHQDRGS